MYSRIFIITLPVLAKIKTKKLPTKSLPIKKKKKENLQVP